MKTKAVLAILFMLWLGFGAIGSIVTAVEPDRIEAQLAEFDE